MSVKVSSWVWENSKTTGNDRLLLLAIADCADDDGDNAWPSIEKLADKATCSERTVQRRIQVLEEDGCLTVDRGAGKNGTHRYRVHMDERAAKPRRVAPPAPDEPVDNPQRGDNLSPLPTADEGGVNLPPGVTELCHRRGDTQVSPERPVRPRTTPPTPGKPGADGLCAHGAAACRRCRTNPRSRGINPRAAAAAEDAELAQRLADRAAAERAATRLAIANCLSCDPDGYLPTSGVCTHDPDAPARAARGAALVRTTMANRKAATR